MNEYKLRWKKLDNGRESAFLDTKLPGRERTKEYLRIYRGGDMSRKDSRDAERLAMAICQKRQQDYDAVRAGIKVERSHKLLLPYYRECCENQDYRESTRVSWRTSVGHLVNYLDYCRIVADQFCLCDVTPEFCKGYSQFLLTQETRSAINRGKAVNCHGGRSRAKVGADRQMSRNSARLTLQKFAACIHRAMHDGIINYDPTIQVDRIKKSEHHRQYLSVDEVQRLMASDKPHEQVCNAFLFACMTGMRISDIRALRWRNVSRYDGHYRLDFAQKKTEGQMYLDISDMARGYMGATGEPDDAIFDLPNCPACNAIIAKWMVQEGINKHITFHCSRHTAAVAMLTGGAEIYTVSKVLGHSSLISTQVYAKIVDRKKTAAVDMLASLYGGQMGDKNG